MNKKPVLLRILITLAVIAVFVISMYPLTPRDFYKTFTELLKNSNDPIALGMIAEAKELQKKNPDIVPSSALLKVATDKGIELKDIVKARHLVDNTDVISAVRKRAASSIRLGMDLNGGVEFLLELIPNKQSQDQAGESKSFERYRDIAIEVLRKRVESQNVFESEISPAGGRYISLKMPIVSKDEKNRLLNLIKMSAKLNFRLVHPNNDELVRQYMEDPTGFVPPIGYQKMETTESRRDDKPLVRVFFVEHNSVMKGDGVVDSFASMDQFGRRNIVLRFNTEGAKRFGEVTSEHVGRQLAIVLDGKLYCAPSIKQAIKDGSAEITGTFSQEEAKNISDALVSGSLPMEIKVDAIFDTDPTLGSDNIANGIVAGLIALVAVMVFMTAYYLRAGVVAVFCLWINIALILGALAAFQATLTLPGIAGIILTMAMAVDANVLIYERIREELAKGKGLQVATELGFSRAFLTIFDSNITTLFVAVILLYFGTGPIKGFAVTLSIGIVTSVFTATFICPLIFDLINRIFHFHTMKMCRWLSNANYNIVGFCSTAITVSLIFIIISIGAMIYRGNELLGIDFTGGTQLTFSYSQRVPQAQVTEALKKAGYDARVSYKSSGTRQGSEKIEIVIRANVNIEDRTGKAESPRDKIGNLLNKTFPEFNLSGGQENSLGGLVGWEFSKSAIIAVILAVIGILIYISLRFEFSYASAAVIALIHDVVISAGVFSLVGILFGGREISLSVLAALLTILGYSLNDTIVVFDRIRENLKLYKNHTYRDIVNLSINGTLSRTILISSITFMVLLILFFFGGVAINDFVLVMLFGVVFGTYSSIYIASPIIMLWHRRSSIDSIKDK